MRKPTVHYKSLRKNLRGISGILRGVPDHINQTNMHHLKVQSYLFLCHSAFEVYIENVTKLIIDTSVMNFHRNRKINSCILSLITHETFAQLDEDTPRRSIIVVLITIIGFIIGILYALLKENYTKLKS